MKKKFGIRKTKMNIFWLFVFGLLFGVVLALRQGPTAQQPVEQIATSTQGETK